MTIILEWPTGTHQLQEDDQLRCGLFLKLIPAINLQQLLCLCSMGKTDSVTEMPCMILFPAQVSSRVNTEAGTTFMTGLYQLKIVRPAERLLLGRMLQMTARFGPGAHWQHLLLS